MSEEKELILRHSKDSLKVEVLKVVKGYRVVKKDWSEE